MHDLSTETLFTKYSLRGVAHGPLMAVSMGAMAVGGALSAASTLAGGNYAAAAGQMQKNAAYYQAGQIEDNANQALASGQRKMFEDQLKTKLAISDATARAGASGVSADIGSPVSAVGDLAARGSYHALMDMFNGQSEATGLRNQAAGVRYSGDLAEFEGKAKRDASRLAAAGTLAGTVGGMSSTYGGFTYPTSRGSAGVRL